MEQKGRPGRLRLWINREIQLRFVIYTVVSLGLASVLISSTTFYTVWNNVFQQLIRSDGAMKQLFDGSVRQFIIANVLLTLLLLVLACLGMLILSHKVAGPAYRLTQILKDLREGKEPQMTLRKGDFLFPVLEELKGFVEYHKSVLAAALRVLEVSRNTEVKDLSFSLALKDLEGKIASRTMSTEGTGKGGQDES